MHFKEIDCGSWGWYFDNDDLLLSDMSGFLIVLMEISLKYGVNISPHSISKEQINGKATARVVENILNSVEGINGQVLQRAISECFYSSEFQSKMLSSVLYIEEKQEVKRILHKDFISVFFSTLKQGRFYSIYFHLGSDFIIQESNSSILPYANFTRFNSYIKELHALMKNYNVSLFDCTAPEIIPSFSLSNEGYFLYENECIFYEDVIDLLPEELKYIPPEDIGSSW